MVKKIKLLFDGDLLSRIVLEKQTGLFRVSDELFKAFAKRDNIELYFLITNNKKGYPEAYLQSRGLPHIIPNIVRMPKLLISTKNRNLYHKIYGGFLRKVLPFFYGKKLKEFDFYFSPHSAISPVIKKVGLKNAILVHDILPILFPSFAKCYKNYKKDKDRLFIEGIDSDIIFFNSKYSRDDFLRYRFPFDFSKTKVCYLSVSDKFFVKNKKEVVNYLEKYNIPNKPYLLCVSESNPRKNFTHTIKSFIKYINDTSDKDLNLIIIGNRLAGYDYLKDIEAFDNYKDRVFITGYVCDDDLSYLYSGASIFMYPSLYEGFGLPVLEAMKCGAPVITANNSSLVEVGGDACAYVSGFDINETSAMIHKVLSDDKFRNDLIEKSKKQVDLFSWDKTIDIILKELVNV